MSVLYHDIQEDQLTARNAKVWNWYTHYQEIYDWLSFNKQSGLHVILAK